MTGNEIAGGEPGPSRSGEIRVYANRESKGGPPGEARSGGAVDTGMRLVDRIRILVEHAGIPTDALDGLPCGQLSREKALHAASDDEGLFVLQVQTSQNVKVVLGPVTHMSIVRISAALSMSKWGGKSQVCDRCEGVGKNGVVLCQNGCATILAVHLPFLWRWLANVPP